MKTATLVLFIACWVVYAVSAPMTRFGPHPDREMFWPRIYRTSLLAAIISFVLMLLVHIAIDAKSQVHFLKRASPLLRVPPPA